MSRKKLSEYRAKTLVFEALGAQYQGLQLDAKQDWHQALQGLEHDKTYVVKVDQAEKGRFKKGLVKLDLQPDQVAGAAQELFDKGYQYVLVEANRPHNPDKERYLSIERLREGNKVSFTDHGGVDVEEHSQDIQGQFYKDEAIEGLVISAEDLGGLIKLFDDNFFSFLEINPYLRGENGLEVLDAAVEVDDEASFFEDGWQPTDIRSPRSGTVTKQEAAVAELSDNSQASFSLELINPDGAVWLLLSGGGASVVVADEVHNLGFGKQLGNYGEYSGNPNTEETKHYTEQVIELMLNSKADKKVLVIAGGVANFTDVRQTFKGVIQALQDHLEELKSQGCSVYVRRGGPHEKEGLQLMRDFLTQAGLHNEVSGPELLLSDIVAHAVKEIDHA